MKIHLFDPIDKDNRHRSLCGIQIKSFTTDDFSKVDCQRCLGSYYGNHAWYWHHRNMQAPGGAQYRFKDEPFPELVVVWRKGEESSRYAVRDIILINLAKE